MGRVWEVGVAPASRTGEQGLTGLVVGWWRRVVCEEVVVELAPVDGWKVGVREREWILFHSGAAGTSRREMVA